VTVIDWARYRKCDVCASETGEACLTLRGLLAGSGPVEEPLEHPHGTRQLRVGYARAGDDRG
jgi:hypothetical protein